MADDRLTLNDFPVHVTLPVQWGEQDLYGHVNNTVHFRWFETARIAYLERIGLAELMEHHKIGPILAAIECNYRRQLKYPDTIYVGAKVTRLGRTSVTMLNAIFSRQQNALIADGESTIVTFHYHSQKPIPIPQEIRDAIERLEGKPLS